MCGLGSRKMSKRSGSGYLAGSWLAAPMLTLMITPAGRLTPQRSTSRLVVRAMPVSGGSHLRPSSMAWGRSDRSSRTASSWSGLVSKPVSRLLEDR